MKDCYCEWRDENGNVHKTRGHLNLQSALRAAEREAERLGLKVVHTNGIISTGKP